MKPLQPALLTLTQKSKRRTKISKSLTLQTPFRKMNENYFREKKKNENNHERLSIFSNGDSQASTNEKSVKKLKPLKKSKFAKPKKKAKKKKFRKKKKRERRGPHQRLEKPNENLEDDEKSEEEEEKISEEDYRAAIRSHQKLSLDKPDKLKPQRKNFGIWCMTIKLTIHTLLFSLIAVVCCLLVQNYPALMKSKKKHEKLKFQNFPTF